MRKALVLCTFVLILAAGTMIAQAHGPGGGTLWSGKPWATVVHTHCTASVNANDFYVSAAGQNVGAGKHSQNPAVVDYYVIAPIVGQPPVAGNSSPCLDSAVP